MAEIYNSKFLAFVKPHSNEMTDLRLCSWWDLLSVSLNALLLLYHVSWEKKYEHSLKHYSFSLLFSFSGVARGCGWQHIGAYVNLGAFYLFGIPVAVVLGFLLHIGGKGLWIGILGGATVQTILLSIVTSCTNWQQQVCSLIIAISMDFTLKNLFYTGPTSYICIVNLLFTILVIPLSPSRQITEFNSTHKTERFIPERCYMLKLMNMCLI